MAFRTDVAKLKHYAYDNNGFLRVLFPAARVGWLHYRNDDGTIRKEYVSEKTLRESADSFKGLPITLGHPHEKVTPENARKYQVGMTNSISFIDNGFLWLGGGITDRFAIDSIVDKKTREVSLGYNTKLVPKGVGFEQVEREGNHVAAVAKARADGAGFRLDGENGIFYQEDDFDAPLPASFRWDEWENYGVDQEQKFSKGINTQLGELNTDAEGTKPMTVDILIDRQVYRVDSENGLLLSKAVNDLHKTIEDKDKELATRNDEYKSLETTSNELKTRLDDAIDQQEELEEELEATKTKLSETEGKLAAAEQAINELKEDAVDWEERSDAADINAEITARQEAWDTYGSYIKNQDPDFRKDYSMSVADIKREYVARRAPHLNLDDFDDVAIDNFCQALRPEDAPKRFDGQDLDWTLDGLRQNRADMMGGGMGNKHKKKKRHPMSEEEEDDEVMSNIVSRYENAYKKRDSRNGRAARMKT